MDERGGVLDIQMYVNEQKLIKEIREKEEELKQNRFIRTVKNIFRYIKRFFTCGK